MNLLECPVFTVRTSGGEQGRYSLPCVFALLMRDEVEAFAKLQAHQKQAWHCFLAQLGAIATEDRDALPASADGWREALSALTEHHEAWNLYTEDLSKPAFMQPPVPEETLDDFSEIHPTEYDVPTLSKNHALKMRRMHSPKSEHWVYLLVNVQTTGFYSPGGRRTSRMNGSYASRPFFGLTPSVRPGPWITRDIRVLRKHTAEIEKRYTYKRTVTPLLWTKPWNGDGSIEINKLHPLYIDCARRIRRGSDAWLKNSTGTEHVTGDVKGQTGDPWAPVHKSESKVLNPSRAAFQYRQLHQILFDGGQYRKPISFRETTEGYVVCRAVTGEQGGRRHNLQRIIPFSSADSGNPFEEENDSKVAEESEWRVKRAGKAASIFSMALFRMFKEDRNDGKTEEVPNFLQEEKNRQINAFHERVDACFFQRLFEAPLHHETQRAAYWETILVGALRAQMREAVPACPNKDRWKRLGRTHSYFDYQIRDTFSYAKQNAKPDDGNETSADRDEEREAGMGQPDARAVADV